MLMPHDFLKGNGYIKLPVFYISFCNRKKNLKERTLTGLFKRQLHVFILIIVVKIGAPVVHGKEFIDTYPFINLVMFSVMGHEKRDLEQLIQ